MHRQSIDLADPLTKVSNWRPMAKFLTVFGEIRVFQQNQPTPIIQADRREENSSEAQGRARPDPPRLERLAAAEEAWRARHLTREKNQAHLKIK